MTFTVDKDVWVHGIEVPSQVTDVPEELTVSETLLVALITFLMMFILVIIAGQDRSTCTHHRHTPCLNEKIDSGKSHLQDLAQCTMCILSSMFSFQPNKLRHILKVAS